MSRYFFALDLTEQSKQEIAQWRTEHIDEHFRYAKPIALTNFHITLVFIGNLSKDNYLNILSALSNSISREKISDHYAISLSNVALFHKPQVLYLGLSNTPQWLSSLQQHIEQITNHYIDKPNHIIRQHDEPQHKEYVPHVSIYRKAQSLPTPAPSLDIYLAINSFSLYESVSSDTGVQYTRKQTWLLP